MEALGVGALQEEVSLCARDRLGELAPLPTSSLLSLLCVKFEDVIPHLPALVMVMLPMPLWTLALEPYITINSFSIVFSYGLLSQEQKSN